VILSRRPTLPLAVWAGGGTGVACLLVVGGSVLVLSRDGGLGTAAGKVLILGLVVSAMAAACAAVAATGLSRGLCALRSDAVRRLQDPAAPLRGPDAHGRLAVRASSELADLARTLDGLHLRVRVADEVAERHRRTAQTASAGMFELLSGLVEAEEGARGQLSAELHDTVAQSLMLTRSLLAGDPSRETLARVAEYVEDAEEQVRAVMARTRPPALREGDLAEAVRVLRDDLAARYGLVVTVSWPEIAYPLPLVTAVTVYRFFQEALLNVVKHADVDAAVASLYVDESGLRATVTDEGPGFEPSMVRSERGRHVGLGLLRERARLAGGSLEISSQLLEGTVLTLRLPCAPGGGLPAAGPPDGAAATVDPRPVRSSDRASGQHPNGSLSLRGELPVDGSAGGGRSLVPTQRWPQAAGR